MADAIVDVAGARIKTDSAGKAVFNLRAGDYTAKITKPGYKTVAESVTVASAAVDKPITLIPA